MYRYYELKSHTAETLCILLRKLNKLPRLPVRWMEWDKEAFEAGNLPDISIIDAIGMSNREIIDVANRCRSSCIALWGSADTVAGLPTLPMNFTAHDLLTITTGVFSKAVRPSMHGSNRFASNEFFRSTIPLGISANLR
jgi:hypothetical protein